MAEMKAAGMEYAARMEELEKVEWPKPLADFVYDAFDAFAEKHPWVGRENVHPKSIAREMFERFAAFHDYVVEYGLQRSEGLLLRYLTDAYKTLLQNVPEKFRDDTIDDFLVQLRAMIKRVDSSLLDEWERLAHGGTAGLPVPEVRPARLGRRPDEGDDPRAFAVRVRAELHALLKALADKNFEEASRAIRQPDGEWPASRIAAELEPYWAEHAQIDVRPIARRPHNTIVNPESPGTWTAIQKIEATDWAIECRITQKTPPLLELVRIGI
jgi:hypothetical protein